MITAFTGKYRFLSNFYPAIVTGPSGLVCESVENAYQAFKTHNAGEQRTIAGARTAAEAKRLGRSVKIRDDWESVRLAVMYRLLQEKFDEESVLAGQLLMTGDEELVEGNHWRDRYWGIDGEGENWLGRLLMLRRSELLL